MDSTETQTAIRPLGITDAFRVSKMYLSFSGQDRHLCHPFPFLAWKLVPLLSFFPISRWASRLIRRILPQAVFICLIAVDITQNRPLGLAYLRLMGRHPAGGYVANLGNMIDSRVRARGIGNRLASGLIRLATENSIREIHLTVSTENPGAIRLSENHGFKIVGTTTETWKGQAYNIHKMTLILG